MSTAEIALASIAAISALVAVASLVISYRQGVRRFQHERELADLADARSLLADCASELARTRSSLRPFYAKQLFPSRSAELPDAQLNDLNQNRDALLWLHASLGLRLPNKNPASVELGSAIAAVSEFIHEFELLPPPDMAAARESAAVEHMKERVDRFDRHAQEFLVAAQSVVRWQI